MNRLRMVALKLAALAPQDRQWLLGRLPAQHRARIAKEMPVARKLQGTDPAQCTQWLHQLAGTGALRSAPAGTDDVSEECIDTIECASVDAIRSVLQGMPRRLLSEFVWYRAWAWKLALIERLPETERQLLVDGPPRSRALAPAALKALLGLVAERVLTQAVRGRSFDAWVQDAASPSQA